MSYDIEKQVQDRLYDEYEQASDRLNAVPGVGSGSMGLTPDHVKRDPAYIAAKSAYDQAFATLRVFNSQFARKYRKEIQQARRERMRCQGLR